MPDRSVSLVVSVRVLPGRRADFLTGISRNAVASVRDEPGCLRFDVAADTVDPDLFWVYEVFADQEALEAHRRTPHFLSWQEQKAALVVPGSQSDRLGALLVSEE
ncbi:putative quinol monooxygenase [Nocardiopsis sp. NRRL B-16309]|uniref:putative quinol monooxygenase n=1 Tax=Nocardiopsis sp. NRRL B-16309 TaxID=1519494 RepID=UPI0006AEA6E3|nr:putative quinol monooxygenase [Nocardiopsis sp. NRRL B-16309]